MNKDRARAGGALAALTTQRQHEFMGEGLRWNDLIREGLAVTQINASRTADAITKINEVSKLCDLPCTGFRTADHRRLLHPKSWLQLSIKPDRSN
ncbi:hypothetical protein [Pedobacter hartonius]|uniref:hypothetical protein n=1 Tax=Pedobacter hartonius TaxID=425514 RepID=UPI00111511BF|nr:hypothetical protein [Pedobacter hartonius]